MPINRVSLVVLQICGRLAELCSAELSRRFCSVPGMASTRETTDMARVVSIVDVDQVKSTAAVGLD